MQAAARARSALHKIGFPQENHILPDSPDHPDHPDYPDSKAFED